MSIIANDAQDVNEISSCSINDLLSLYNHQAINASGGGFETDDIEIKLGYLTADHNTCKVASLVSGSLKITAPGAIGSGTYQTINIAGLKQYAYLLQNLPTSAVLTFGHYERGGGFEFVKDGTESPGQIARSGNYIDYRIGPKMVLLDVDTKNWNRKYTPPEIIELLGGIIPAFADVGYVVSASSSANLRDRDGNELTGAGNFHIAFVYDGDVAVLKATLKNLFRLHGYVRPWLTNPDPNGRRRVRDAYPIDMMVFSGERLVYEAPPLCNDGIYRDYIAPTYKPGTVLREADLPEITPFEIATGKQLWGAMKADANIDEIQRRSQNECISIEDARRSIAIEDSGYLSHDTVLYTPGRLERLTVGDLWEKYENLDWSEINGKLLCCVCDPAYDGFSYPQKAIVYANNYGLRIVDQGHGLTKYTITDPDAMVVEGDTSDVREEAKRLGKIQSGVNTVLKMIKLQSTHAPLSTGVKWVSDMGIPLVALGHGTAIDASLARGKTTAIYKLIEAYLKQPESTNDMWLVLVPRNSLAKSIAREIGGTWFNDPLLAEHDISTFDTVVGCPEGLLKFGPSLLKMMEDGRKLNIVFDEGDQSLDSLYIGGTMANAGVKRVETLAYLGLLFTMIGQGHGRLIMAEANLTQLAIDDIDSLSGNSIKLDIWDCWAGGTPHKRDCYISDANNRQLKASATAKIEALLKAGETVYVGTGSQRWGRQLEVMFGELYPTLRMDRQTIGEEQNQNILGDVKGHCQENGIRLFIGSPSISTGVSIKAGWFTACVVYGGHLSYRQTYQNSMRVRDGVPLYVYVYEQASKAGSTDFDDIKQSWDFKASKLLESHGFSDHRRKAFFLECQDRAAKRQAFENGASKYQRELLVRLLRKDGHQLHSIAAESDAICKAIGGRLAQASDVVEQADLELYMQAQIMPLIDAERIKSNGAYESHAHYVAVRKSILAASYPTQYQDDMWVRTYFASPKSMENWKRYKQHRTLMGLDLSKAIEKTHLEAAIAKTGDLWVASADITVLRLEWLKSCGLDLVLELASTDGIWCETIAAYNFMAACLSDTQRCEEYLGLRDRERSKTSVMKFVGVVFGVLGVETTVSRCRKPPSPIAGIESDHFPVTNDLNTHYLPESDQHPNKAVKLYKITQNPITAEMVERDLEQAETNLDEYKRHLATNPLPIDQCLPKLAPKFDPDLVTIDYPQEKITEYCTHRGESVMDPAYNSGT